MALRVAARISLRALLALAVLAACTVPADGDGGSDGDNPSSGGTAGGATVGGDASGSATDMGTTGGTSADGSGSDGVAPDMGAPGIDGNAYFVAPDGDDANPGTLAEPFGTFEHAIDVVDAGGMIFVRGGTYMLERSIAIDKSGAPDQPIRLWAYEDEEPILDFSGNPRHADPPQPREDDSIAATSDAVGIFVAGDWWHLEGLTIRNAAYYGVRVYGSNNVFEQLVLHDNKASGLELTGKEDWSPSDNLVLDCDSFHNFDPQGNGEDADGFAAKFDTLGPGNVFRGTRAWSNADDGYDFWHAAPVVVEDAWSFDNGFNRDEWASQLTGGYEGDGMGFKLGQDAGEIRLQRVVAWGNKAFGIDENGNGSAGGVTIDNATVVNNSKDGDPTQIDLDDGRPHTVRNTIAFDVDGTAVTNLGAEVQDTANTWNGIGVGAADFVSLDMVELFATATGPRDPDGSLPEIGLRLAAGSGLIDAGIDVGLPYVGDAPDLGAFETAR